MISQAYKSQVDLLIRIIPYIAEEKIFALKGGTAINMFIWDMPRLSVDIDLTYLPFDDRNTAIANITNALLRLRETIKKSIVGINVAVTGKEPEAKLICNLKNAQVKIEVNTIMRGGINSPTIKPLSEAAQAEFGKFVEIQVASHPDIFGGKICAALDRQHPRDLFDVKQLFELGGITEAIKEGVIAAILSHNRPIHEILNPNFSEQKTVFDSQFYGMTLKPFSYQDYEDTRIKLVSEINGLLTDNDKKLLLSFKSGNPDWNLSKISALPNLPAVKWKLQNIHKLQANDKKKHEIMLDNLRTFLKI